MTLFQLLRGRWRSDASRPQRIQDPSETYSPWDQGMQYWTAWIAGVLLIVIVLGNLVLALEVLGLL